ncbi:MAG: hypothetical protein R2702_03605 [Acidimicrobiales bacterium]
MGGPSVGIYYQTNGPAATGGSFTKGTAGSAGSNGQGCGRAGGPGGQSDRTAVQIIGITLWSFSANGGLDGFAGRVGTDATTTVAAAPACRYWSGGYQANGTANCVLA